MQSDLEAFIVCLSSELHAKIKANAKANRRSMNKEIVVRLERSFVPLKAYLADTKIKGILFEHIETLEDQIEQLKAELAAYKL